MITVPHYIIDLLMAGGFVGILVKLALGLTVFGMAQTTGTIPANTDNINKTFYAIMKDKLKELQRIYPDYYNIRTSNLKYERVVTYVPFGDTQTKAEGAPYAMDELRQGYTKDFIHTENALGFQVTQTAMDDDLNNLLQRGGDWLAYSARYVEEGRAAGPLNNGFTTETTPDGAALFSTAHILAGGGSAKNTLSTAADLSAASLVQALIDLQTDTKDEAGHLAAPIQKWLLVVPPALEFLGDRLLHSIGLPGSADNDRNPIKSRRSWDIIVNPRLTDSDAWFVLAADKATHGLTFYKRLPPTLDTMMIDPQTKDRIFSIRHRFSVGAWAWQNLYGSPGA